MLVLAWYGKKNTGKLSYFCPSVPLRKLIQFSWLIWALYPSVSFSETQGHIFVACSHVASLALLLVHHHPTNIYLLGPEDKAKSISQGTTILVRNRKSKQLQNTVIKWNDTSYLLPTTLVVMCGDGRIWIESLRVQREKWRIKWDMILELSFMDDGHLLISKNLICFLSC